MRPLGGRGRAIDLEEIAQGLQQLALRWLDQDAIGAGGQGVELEHPVIAAAHQLARKRAPGRVVDRAELGRERAGVGRDRLDADLAARGGVDILDAQAQAGLIARGERDRVEGGGVDLQQLEALDDLAAHLGVILERAVALGDEEGLGQGRGDREGRVVGHRAVAIAGDAVTDQAEGAVGADLHAGGGQPDRLQGVLVDADGGEDPIGRALAGIVALLGGLLHRPVKGLEGLAHLGIVEVGQTAHLAEGTPVGALLDDGVERQELVGRGE